MFFSDIKKLQNKIESLENKVQKLEKKSRDFSSDVGLSIFTKNLLNYQVMDKKRFRIKTIDNNESNSLYFQLKICFFNYLAQDVCFKMYADKIQIASNNDSYANGKYETIISGTFQNFISNKVKIDLQIIPKSGKQLTIIGTTLTVWGLTPKISEEYNAIETSTKYYLSYISNSSLYFKQFDKTFASKVDDFDFSFLDEAISHSLCNANDEVYLFRVNPSGDLFFSKLQNFNEIFISNNVSKVCCCYFNNFIIFSYIKDNECYIGEISNGVVISNNKIKTPFGKYSDCYLYSNTLNNKCYLIITKEDNSNYLLENINSNYSSSENINAEINISLIEQETL